MFRLRIMSSRSLEADNEEQSVGLLRNMEARAEHQKIKHYHTVYTLTTSVGVGLLTFMLFWLIHFRNGFAWQSNPALQFNWHPFLMTLGMVFLYSQAMLTYRTGRKFEKKTLKLVHAGLNFLAFIVAVVGLKAAFDSHNLKSPPVPNLYTLHSWIGLATVIVFSLQFLFGFISFLFPGLSQSLRKVILPIHVAFGAGCFVGAILAAVTGLLEKAIFALKDDYEKYTDQGIVVNWIGICVAIYGILVLYLVHEANFKRAPLVDDEIVLNRSE